MSFNIFFMHHKVYVYSMKSVMENVRNINDKIPINVASWGLKISL